MDDDELLPGEEMVDDDRDEQAEFEQLALNSNFDPALLFCWEGEAQNRSSYSSRGTKDNANETIHESGVSHGSGSDSIAVPDETEDTAWDEFDKAQQALLLPTSVAGAANPVLHSSSSAISAAAAPVSVAVATTEIPSLPPFDTTATGTDSSTSSPSNNAIMSVLDLQQQQQALNASFPPTTLGAPAASAISASSATSTTTGGLSQPQTHPSFLPAMPAPLGNSPMDNMALLPLAFNALAAGVDLSSFFCWPPASDVTVASGAVAAPGIAPAIPGAIESVAAMPNVVVPPAAAASPTPVSAVSAAAAAAPTEQPQQTSSKQTAATNKRANGGPGRRSRTSKGQQQRQTKQRKKKEEEEEEPPFMLFDAPVELRHNFIQSQRAHGLPVLHDNNSYHFARSAASVTPTPLISADGATSMIPTSTFAHASHASNRPMPRLVDARHGDDTVGSKRIKNAKEQKRAQRITELIEQLRIRMEKGGWKVGIKSKLHTLSSCSDYVKHLVQTTREKQTAVDQARRDLEAKQCKMEEDQRAAQQDPSEPESTTSSLTVSSGSGCATNKHNKKKEHSPQDQKHHQQRNSSSDDKANTETKPPPNCNRDGGNAGATSSLGESGQSPEAKKRKLSSHQESNSEDYSSSVDQDDYAKKKRAEGGVGPHVFLGSKSSVSDITDHNKYARESSTVSGSDEANANPPLENADNAADPSAQNTVCSDAAVAQASDPKDLTSHGSSTGKVEQADGISGMAIQTITTTSGSTNSGHRKRKHPPHEQEHVSGDRSGYAGKKCRRNNKLLSARDATSLERSFQLDYEEVFLKSNVPQLIATTTGRILAHNDMFLLVTRLRRSHVERMTIFSLVQPSMLSNLFELVASSLREDDSEQEEKEKRQEQESEQKLPPPNEKGIEKAKQATTAKAKNTPLYDYSTMTLPCVAFVNRPTLFMTITLMSDVDVKKRCFHCVFTDRAPGGAKGAVGTVTPQLLETLFQGQPRRNSGSSRLTNASSAARGAARGADGTNEGSSSSSSGSKYPPSSSSGSRQITTESSSQTDSASDTKSSGDKITKSADATLSSSQADTASVTKSSSDKITQSADSTQKASSASDGIQSAEDKLSDEEQASVALQ